MFLDFRRISLPANPINWPQNNLIATRLASALPRRIWKIRLPAPGSIYAHIGLTGAGRDKSNHAANNISGAKFILLGIIPPG